MITKAKMSKKVFCNVASGSYSFNSSHEGALEVVASGGQYVDEASGETVDLGTSEIKTLISSLEDNDHVGVNALTTIAAAKAHANAANGLANAIAASQKEVADMFGLSGVDIVRIKPKDLTNPDEEVDAESAEAKLGLAMSSMSQMAKDQGLQPAQLADLVKGFSEDYSDGSFDGKAAGEPLSVAISVTPEAALKGLSTAMENFIKGPRNKAGFSPASIPSIPEIPTATKAPEQGSTEAPTAGKP